MIRIFKFGGASVKDAEGVKNLGKIVKNHLDTQLLVVVSAMGKTTNHLEVIADLAFKKEIYQHELVALFKYHDEISLQLFGHLPETYQNWKILLEENLKKEVENWLEFYDSVISYGELISTCLVHEYLKTQINSTWLDARKYVKTNSFFTEANVDWQLTGHFIKKEVKPFLETGVVITQGFIGSDLTGKPTTLGREGSDYSGAIFAYCLEAESFTVWKDVPGLLNADPKMFPAAEKFDELSFQEVTELTYYGAKVIHPKTIRPLAQGNIPLYVRSFLDPEAPGTKVSDNEKLARKPCYVFKENQLLISLRVRDNSFMDEKKLGVIFQALDAANVKINLMHNSALTFTFCMDFNQKKLEKIKDFLDRDFQILYNTDLFLATVKNYDDASFDLLPAMKEKIIEQKTRHNYQVVYRPS